MKNLIKNKLKYFLIIIVFFIITPIYIRQYEITYPNLSERKKLSIEGLFMD